MSGVNYKSFDFSDTIAFLLIIVFIGGIFNGNLFAIIGAPIGLFILAVFCNFWEEHVKWGPNKGYSDRGIQKLGSNSPVFKCPHCDVILNEDTFKKGDVEIVENITVNGIFKEKAIQLTCWKCGSKSIFPI